MKLISKYFPGLNQLQTGQYGELLRIVPQLNEKVNIISRRDVDHLEERHVLHSLAIACQFPFSDGTSVMDVGTGGGFPGIPLAIMFPQVRFVLVDSIGKKIRIVEQIAGLLGLQNIITIQERMEKLDMKVDFVVSRAVTSFPELHRWAIELIKPGKGINMPNGLISLKGGDLTEELAAYGNRAKQFLISQWFEESFFYTKKIVYLEK
jgi:16S rRNA (guanine527-N7)-methyltransferase